MATDTFLIKIGIAEPILCFVKCTLEQATHLMVSQIPLAPYIVADKTDLDTELLRIHGVFAKFPDASPFIFEMMIVSQSTNLSSIQAHVSLRKILDVILDYAPLIPKSTRKDLLKYYLSLCVSNFEQDSSYQARLTEVYLSFCIRRYLAFIFKQLVSFHTFRRTL